MASKDDYYKVLGVPRNAELDEIKRAYRKLAFKHHPDRNKNNPNAEAAFKAAAEAYEVLSNAETRARYDRFGHEGVRGQFHEFTSFDDIFSAFGDIFGGQGGVFGDLFGSRSSTRSQRGASLRCAVNINLNEAATGKKRTIEIRRRETCADCGGSGARKGTRPTMCATCGGRGQVSRSQGFFAISSPCPRCHGAGQLITNPCTVCSGSGLTLQKREITVDIPAGVEDGMRLRLSGEGEPGGRGAPRGDLFVDIQIAEHPLFERRGADILCQVPITFAQAALGAEIEVPTLDRPRSVTVKRGTQPGDILRLPHMGMPQLRSGRRGDQLVIFTIEVPTKLSARQRQLLREYASTEDSNPLPQRESWLDKVRQYFSSSQE